MDGRITLSPPTLAYVGPFAVFVGLLALMPRLHLEPRASLSIWLVTCTLAILLWSRGVLEFRPSQWLLSSLLGVAVFVLWIAPDFLVTGWRAHWLFQNAVTGELKTSLPPHALTDTTALALRILRASLVVPIVEELFWRGWLLRWLINPDFEKVPLGAFAPIAFWVAALLFALEHGPYWDVGLIAGILYNWWMLRTRRLSDLILAHAVTNACLSAFILWTGRWEYWL